MLPTAESVAPSSKTSHSSSGGGGGGGCSIARPLAPPEVGHVFSDDEEDDEEEESDGGDGQEEPDEALVEAVEELLKEVEVLRKASSFPSLDALSTIDKAGRYLGPTMESNWVLPGRLLVGAYPASMNDSHHAHLLCTILLQGVSTFVCLQQEYRSEGVTEEMWRGGDALRPYFSDVLQLLGKLGELKRADPRSVPAICSPEDTAFVHFPIVDCNVADDTKVLQLAAQLAARLARGEVMYLHCWGGHGRTGTVVCIMLHLMYGLSADEAMERCQHVHDVRRIPISVGSPQTEAQRQQVRRVIGYVISHRQSLPPTPPRPQQQQQQRLSASPFGSRGGANSGSSGGGSASPLTPDSTSKKRGDVGGGSGNGVRPSVAGSAATAVGGRRAWVRGRRQAFAQAPNGVGEEVSGWLAGDDGEHGTDADDRAVHRNGGGDQEKKHKPQRESGYVDSSGGGKWTKAEAVGRTAAGCGRRDDDVSWGSKMAARMQSSSGALPPPSGLGSRARSGSTGGGSELGAGGASSVVPRRKSFNEPYSEEDPSRGTRMSPARRKSAPGKPPAEVLAAAGVSVLPDVAKEDCCDGDGGGSGGVMTKNRGVGASAGAGSLSLSPANRRTRRHSRSCVGGVDVSASPGSCTGVERSIARSGGGAGTGSAAGHAPSPCGANGATSCRAR